MSEKEEINITIIGGNFVGKGAEAMMLVVIDKIGKFFPLAKFWAIPIFPGDADRMKKAGINILYQKPTNRFTRLIRGLSAFIGLKNLKEYPSVKSGDEVYNIFSNSDIVIDISGFAYSDQQGIKTAYNGWLRYAMVNYKNSKLLFLPQSWGPFDNKLVRLFTCLTLKKASLISAREKVSHMHLINSRCARSSEIFYCPDIAFLFHVDNPEKIAQKLLDGLDFNNKELPYITITPNMRIYERVGGDHANNHYIHVLVELINNLLKSTNSNIVIIPHEASFPTKKNDTELCALLVELINSPKRVATLPDNLSATQVKAVIGSSVFLYASRYHSLVAALSMRTPVATIGWAHKYDELMQIVGLSEFVFDLVRNTESENIAESLINAYNNRQIISENIKLNVPIIESKVENVFNRIVEIIIRGQANLKSPNPVQYIQQ
jgi:polysaccharide pyruvyl transferase WcaK-like protein